MENSGWTTTWDSKVNLCGSSALKDERIALMDVLGILKQLGILGMEIQNFHVR